MTYDVVVVGAGPAGLMLACELSLAGVDVLVLERLTEPDPTIKAGSITAPTAQAFDRRGLLAPLRETQEQLLTQIKAVMAERMAKAADAPGPAKLPPRFVGHFAAIHLTSDFFDENDPAFAGLGPAGDVGLVPQLEVERILGGRAAELGVEIRRGAVVTDVAADADGVTISLEDDAIRAGWVVGCDGGRSVVRKRSGFDFPGTDPQITAYQAIAKMRGAEGVPLGWHRTERGVYVLGPTPGRVLTVEFDGAPADRTGPVSPAELESSIRRVTGGDITVHEIQSVTRFTDNARQATTYRQGRVLLAGDAAHVHSPFGGQGLNLSVGDAFNLGWKLAAVVQGRAPESLLDTYTAERHPIGAWVLEWTRAQIAVMRPGPWAGAARKVVEDLIRTTAGTTYMVKQLSGVWHRYDLPGDHPLTGGSAPELILAEGGRVGDHLHAGTGVLFRFTDAMGPATAGYEDRVRVVQTGTAERPELAAMLVRPDGIVAWAADLGTPDDGSLATALRTWFGEPALSGGAGRHRSEPELAR
jgi:2-polyprenyl-6-methoxyphenol hydroxylase-like FAD-dependent oxidoreductase